MKVLCNLMGHNYSVVWNIDGKSEATFCKRCGSWIKHEATLITDKDNDG